MINAAPISLTTSCYGDVVPLHLFAEAISITCIFECVGVFAMPNVAGKIADITTRFGVLSLYKNDLYLKSTETL